MIVCDECKSPLSREKIVVIEYLSSWHGDLEETSAHYCSIKCQVNHMNKTHSKYRGPSWMQLYLEE